jgi:hypothetical protein
VGSYQQYHLRYENGGLLVFVFFFSRVSQKQVAQNDFGEIPNDTSEPFFAKRSNLELPSLLGKIPSIQAMKFGPTQQTMAKRKAWQTGNYKKKMVQVRVCENWYLAPIN